MQNERICFYILHTLNPEKDFSSVVRLAKTNSLSDSIVNDQPPPPREIVLDVARARLDELADENFNFVVGIVVDEDLCFKSRLPDPEALAKMRRCFVGAKRHNPIVAHHGFYLAIFSFGSDVKEQIKMLQALENFKWKNDDNLKINFEIIDSIEVLSVFLKGQYRRVAVSEAMYRHEVFS